MENIRNIIESLLFVADEPLTVDKIKRVLETADAKEIRNNLNALADQYEARGGGFRLTEVAGGWQLRSRPEYNEYIKRLLQPSPQRLSRAALETLAIVAYNQPIIRADIEHIRGVDCGGMLRQLLERKLIRVLGRKEIPGRPLIYATSKLFLGLFELKNLKDLPTPKEIEEISTPGKNDQETPGNDRGLMVSATEQPVTPRDLSDGPLPSSTDLVQGPPSNDAKAAGFRRAYRPTYHQYPSHERPTGIKTELSSVAKNPHKIGSKPSVLGSHHSSITGNSERQSPYDSKDSGKKKREEK